MVVIVVMMVVVVVVVMSGHGGKIRKIRAMSRRRLWYHFAKGTRMGTGANRAGLAALAGLSLWLIASEARAANNAYAVDAADISETGSCKIESWLSSATNTDFSAVANPSCVVDPFRAVELSLPTSHSRSG